MFHGMLWIEFLIFFLKLLFGTRFFVTLNAAEPKFSAVIDFSANHS